MNGADYYIDRVKRLPPAPTIATRLLGLFGDPDRDIDRVVELISHDPSLTAEMLKRCNSAYFGSSRPASDIAEAVGRLGFNEVYSVVLVQVSARALTVARAGSGVDPGNLWRHSVTTAVAADTLAKWLQEAEAVAFTAGLLHDLGKLIFASAEANAYAQIVRKAGGFGPALAKAEGAAFNLTHAELGARLLARWGLPGDITRAVLYHHTPPSPARDWDALTVIVRLANELAHELTGEVEPGAEPSPTQKDALTRLQLPPEQLPGVREQIQQQLQRVESLLEIKA